MNDFREAVERFRDAVREQGEQAANPGLQIILERDRARRNIRMRWTVAAVVMLFLGAIPVYKRAQDRQREAEQEKADSLLLEQVNAGLARSVPRALAPLMGWTPANASSQGEDR
jgi:hypothetical protein